MDGKDLLDAFELREDGCWVVIMPFNINGRSIPQGTVICPGELVEGVDIVSQLEAAARVAKDHVRRARPPFDK